MIPLARTKNLLISQVGEEVIVYDQERDTAHCLNAMAARVWHYCDGQNTVEDIAKLLEEDLEVSADEDVDWRGLVWLTLEELQRFYLIQEYLSQPISSEVQSADALRVSRRKMIKTATLVGGFAVGSMFPLVKSIVAPYPAMATPGGSGFNKLLSNVGISSDDALEKVKETLESFKKECTKECAPCKGEVSEGAFVTTGAGNSFTATVQANCVCVE